MYTRTHSQCCLSVAHDPLLVCDMNISCCSFSLGIALLWYHHIPWYSKGRKRFAWCCLIYQNLSFINYYYVISLFSFGAVNVFSNPIFVYKEFRICSPFPSVVCFHSVSPLGLTSLAACCRIVGLHCGLPADVSWNPWAVAAHWGCHIVIHAAVACRLSLLVDIPVCVVAMCPGHMDISWYLVSVIVWELTLPEGFGCTCQIWMNLLVPLGSDSYWGKKKIINIFPS